MKLPLMTEVLLRIEHRSATPKYRQIERGLRAAIQSGRLEAQAQLPTTRDLARTLGVSRGVVLEAYEQLASDGYVISRQGSGTRVAPCTQLRVAAEPVAHPVTSRPVFDFRPGIPDARSFPYVTWANVLRDVLREAPVSLLDYPHPQGPVETRIALAQYLARARAVDVDSNRLVVCSGFTQGVELALATLRRRGASTVAIEDPGAPLLCERARAHGMNVVRIPVDELGVDVTALDACAADLIIVSPAHQYPTGTVMSEDRRSALVGWARRHRAYVIEDDYDAEYRYDIAPIAALQSLCPDHVIYIGTASKVLAPSLRLGWIVAPHALVEPLASAKARADRGASVLDQLALARFLYDGHFERHLRAMRNIYQSRRGQLLRAIGRHQSQPTVRGVAAGLHVMLDLPGNVDEARLIALAQAADMSLVGARSYHQSPSLARPSLILGYGAICDSKIASGIDLLYRIIGKSGGTD